MQFQVKMSGCLMQLVAYGAQDYYLTGGPSYAYTPPIEIENDNSLFDLIRKRKIRERRFNNRQLRKWKRHLAPVLVELRKLQLGDMG
mgnify:CR=1 FL=1